MPDIVFIDSRPDQKSVRLRELERSKALAHTAFVVHQRKKGTEAGCIKVRKNSIQARQKIEHTSPTRLAGLDTSDHASRTRSAISSRSQPILHSIHLINPKPQLDYGLCWGHFLRNIPEIDREQVRRCAEFYISTILPVHDFSTKVFNCYNIGASWLNLLSQPLFYDAGIVLTGMYQRGTNRESIRLNGPVPPGILLWRTSRAVSKILTYLSLPGWRSHSKRAGLVTSVLCLALCAAAEGCYEAALRHFAGLQQVMHELETSDSADLSQEKSVAMAFEASIAMKLNTSVFASNRRQWNPVYPVLDDRLLATCEVLPSGFRELIITGQLSMDIIVVLRRLCSINALQSTRFHRRVQANWWQEPCSYSDPTDACPVLIAPNQKEHLLEKMLTCTIVMFCRIISSSVAPPPGANSFTSTITAEIIDTYEPNSDLQRDAQLWALIVVMESCRCDLRIDVKGMALFQRHLQRFPDLAAMPWIAVEQKLSQFLWSESLNDLWRQCWPNVVESALARHYSVGLI